MTPEQFTYWLQGFVELTNTKTISEQQWQAIKDHLSLVFNKVTPDRFKEEEGVQVQEKKYIDKLNEILRKLNKQDEPYVPVTPYKPPSTPFEPFPPSPWKLPEVTCSIKNDTYC